MAYGPGTVCLRGGDDVIGPPTIIHKHEGETTLVAFNGHAVLVSVGKDGPAHTEPASVDKFRGRVSRVRRLISHLASNLSHRRSP